MILFLKIISYYFYYVVLLRFPLLFPVIGVCRRWGQLRLSCVLHGGLCYNLFFFSLAPQPPWALASAFSFMIILWTSDQLVARPLPKHRTTQTQNKRIHTPNVHALSGIRTHDPSVRASEESSCLRPLGYCDWLQSNLPCFYYISIIYK
jgi:hypothetical protein